MQYVYNSLLNCVGKVINIYQKQYGAQDVNVKIPKEPS